MLEIEAICGEGRQVRQQAFIYTNSSALGLSVFMQAICNSMITDILHLLVSRFPFKSMSWYWTLLEGCDAKKHYSGKYSVLPCFHYLHDEVEVAQYLFKGTFPKT